MIKYRQYRWGNYRYWPEVAPLLVSVPIVPIVPTKKINKGKNTITLFPGEKFFFNRFLKMWGYRGYRDYFHQPRTFQPVPTPHHQDYTGTIGRTSCA